MIVVYILHQSVGTHLQSAKIHLILLIDIVKVADVLHGLVVWFHIADKLGRPFSNPYELGAFVQVALVHSYNDSTAVADSHCVKAVEVHVVHEFE